MYLTKSGSTANGMATEDGGWLVPNTITDRTEDILSLDGRIGPARDKL